MKYAVCAIAKNENRYIYEWTKHHLQIGFSHIHIYDNNDVDGERIEDVFLGTDIEDKVTIHDVRGKTCMQLEVYQECHEREEFDWCAFIDIDEFITFTNPKMTIAEFLKDKKDFEAVHLNWLCYGDDDQLKSDGRGVLDRIAHPIQPLDFKAQYITISENAHVKSIIRKGLKIDWNGIVDGMPYATPHTPAGLQKVCNAKGEIVRNMPWMKLDHSICYVAHYITKTIEEYAIKVQRRAADSNSYYHTYTRFFHYNRLSLRKLCAIQKISSHARVIPILVDAFKWWNFSHRTTVSRLYKQYQRMLKEENEYGYEK